MLVSLSLTIKHDLLLALHGLILGILPAPNNIRYSEGHQQIFWEPPTIASDKFGSQNIRIDSRITHFEIYITNGSIATVYNTSGTSFAIETDEISCSFWFQVAAVNPAGVGEQSPPQTFDCEFACLLANNDIPEFSTPL